MLLITLAFDVLLEISIRVSSSTFLLTFNNPQQRFTDEHLLRYKNKKTDAVNGTRTTDRNVNNSFIIIYSNTFKYIIFFKLRIII